MSKRHGATGAEEYEALGYLPEAMRNYLARLSWSHGNDEIFTTEQAIAWFGLDSCSKGAPCFDFFKLDACNQHYMKEASADRLYDIMAKFHPEVKAFEKKLRMPRISDLLKDRAKTVVQYREAAEFIIVSRPIGVLAAAGKNMASDAAKDILRSLLDVLKKYNGEWTPEGLETPIKAFADSKSLKLGDVAKPSRAALTGSTASPGLFEVIWCIGKDIAIGRLEDAIKGVNPVKEPPAPPAPAKEEPAKAPAAAKPAASSAPISGDIEAQVKATGDEIRDLKIALKAGGMSGKKIDKSDEVVALVAKLTELKAAQAAGPAPAAAKAASPKGSPKAAPKAAPAAAGGDVAAQITAVGDEIRALKTKLKADGMSGKKIDKCDEVVALVAKLTELKAAA